MRKVHEVKSPVLGSPAGNGPDFPASQDVHLHGHVLGFPGCPAQLPVLVLPPCVAFPLAAHPSGVAFADAYCRPSPYDLQRHQTSLQWQPPAGAGANSAHLGCAHSSGGGGHLKRCEGSGVTCKTCGSMTSAVPPTPSWPLLFCPASVDAHNCRGWYYIASGETMPGG